MAEITLSLLEGLAAKNAQQSVPAMTAEPANDSELFSSLEQLSQQNKVTTTDATTASDYFTEPFQIAREFVSGIPSGVAKFGRAARTLGIIEGESPFITKLESAAESIKSDQPSKIPLMKAAREAAGSTAETLITGLPFAYAAARGGRAGGIKVPPGKATGPLTLPGGIVGAGGILGLAEHDSFLEDMEKVANANRGSEQEFAKSQDLIKKYAVVSGLIEAGGEVASDLIALKSFKGKPKQIDAALLKRVNTAITNFAGSYLKASVGEITGEELTTIVQYGARKAAYETIQKEYPTWITPNQENLWSQIKSTAATTAFQTLYHGLFLKGLSHGQAKEIRKEEINKIAEMVSTKYNVDKATTAKTTADIIVNAPEDRVANAVKSLEQAKKPKQKKTTAEKAVDTIIKAENIVAETPYIWKQLIADPYTILTPGEAQRQYELMNPIAPEVETAETVPIEKKSRKRVVKKETFVPPIDQDSLAATGTRVATKLGITADQLTPEILMSETGIVDADKANVIVNAAKRNELGFVAQPIQETTVATVAAAVEPAPTEGVAAESPIIKPFVQNLNTATSLTPVIIANRPYKIMYSEDTKFDAPNIEEAIDFINRKMPSLMKISKLGEWTVQKGERPFRESVAEAATGTYSILLKSFPEHTTSDRVRTYIANIGHELGHIADEHKHIVSEIDISRNLSEEARQKAIEKLLLDEYDKEKKTTETKAPVAEKRRVAFKHMQDFGTTTQISGKRFVPMVQVPIEGGMTDVAYNPEIHELTNPDDFNAASALTGTTRAKEVALAKIAPKTEGESINLHLENEPSFEQSKVLSKEQTDKYIDLVKKYGGGDLYKMIRNLVHPRGEGMSTSDVANSEGLAEILVEAGVPASAVHATIKSIAIESGALTADEVVMEKFDTSVDFDLRVGQEFDRLIDSGRATELEKLGLTEEQIDAVLGKEAEEEAERAMQEKYDVVDEKLTDPEMAVQETAEVEPQIIDKTVEDELGDELDEPGIEREVVFTTKREAIVERNKKDTPANWTVEKVKERTWVLKKAEKATATVVGPREQKVASHPLFQNKETANNIIDKLIPEGIPPDRFKNPIAFLEAIHANVSKAFHEQSNIKTVFPILNGITVDLKQQVAKFNLDTKGAKEALEYAGKIASYATTVGESLGLRRGFNVETLQQASYYYNNLIDTIYSEFQRDQDTGIPKSAADWVRRVLETRVISPQIRAILNEIMGTPSLLTRLEEVPVHFKTDTFLGTSYYLGGEIFHSKVYIKDDTHMLGYATIHEVMHALVYDAMKNNPEFDAAITNLRKIAIRNGLSPHDAVAISKLTAIDFRGKSASQLGLSGEQGTGIYYGLVDNDEFISQITSSMDFIEFTESIQYETEPLETGSLFKKFISSLIHYVFKKQPTMRSTTLLDGVLKEVATHIEPYWSDSRAELADMWRETSASARRGVALQGMLSDKSKYKTKDILDAINNGEINLPSKKPRDANWFSQVLVSPDAVKAIKSDPLADKLVNAAIDAEDEWRYQRGLGFEEVERMRDSLTDEQRLEATTAMRKIEAGTLTVDAVKATPVVKTAIADMTQFFESYKTRMKDMLRRVMIRDMNQTQMRIFNDVLVNGMEATEATKKWNKYARQVNKQRTILLKQGVTNLPNREAIVTYASVGDLFVRYEEIKTWGIDNYITKAMRGSIVITDEKHRVVTVAETTNQALERSINALRNWESLETGREAPTKLFVETDFHLDRETPTLVSSRGYHRMQGRVVKAMSDEAKALNVGLNKAVANKVLRGTFTVGPRSIHTPFTEERHEILTGEEDIFTILPAYVHMMEKKIALDPYVQQLRKNIDVFNDRPHVKAILNQQLEDMRGKYWTLDRIADSFVKKLGISLGEAQQSIEKWIGHENTVAIPPAWTEKPFVASRMIGQTRNVIANMKLGYRQIASIINLMSGLGHVWVKTNLRHMYNAAKILRTDEGKAFIKRYAPSLGTHIVAAETGQIKSAAKWWHPMGTFQLAETPNREMSFIATYLFGKDAFNLKEAEAVEFAKRGVRLQQFNYNMASLPKVLRGPGGRLIGQFKTYLVKEIEFIRSLSAGEWVKYLGMQVALGGPKGLLITLKSLPPLIVLMGLIGGMRGGGDWLDDLEEWINNNLPRTSRGMFGYFGIDASGPASFQFPTRWQDWTGIVVSDIVNFGQNVAKPFMQGEKYIKWHLLEASKQMVPAWKVWSDMIESHYHDGWIWDAEGIPKYKVESPEDWAKAAIGAKPLRLGLVESQNRIIAKQKQDEMAQVHNIVVNAVHLRRRLGDDGVVAQIINDCMTYKVSPSTLVTAIERAEMEPMMRIILKTKLANQLDVWQRLRKAGTAQESVR